MILQRFYFDTSVFGGVFDNEFEEESLLIFEKVRLGQIICLYSALTEKELAKAPERVKQFFEGIKEKNGEFIDMTIEAYSLAKAYLDEKVVGETSFDDCLHIAMATLNDADILVSWNFKHIVNVYRIRGYNLVNLRLGYHQLEIRSPREIVGL